MDSETTVYGKPDCYGCKATVRKLEHDKVPFNYVDITVNEAAYQEVKRLGYESAPVVVAGEQHWSGFRPDRLGGLKK